jgi:hypothetical protein
LSHGQDERTRALLDEGFSLLEAHREREAADVFGRYLLEHPGHPEARQGLARARAALTERERVLADELAQAQRALEAGDRGEARARLEAVVRGGGDRDRALALLDRLDDRGGLLDAPAPPSAPAPSLPAAAPAGAAGRRVYAVLCVGCLALLAGGLGLRWESLVGSVARIPAPAPRALPRASQWPEPTPGEKAISEARRRLEQGDAKGAAAALSRVAPGEPAYPFARQLLEQAQAAGQSEPRR